jgi:hypothetical protein
MQGATGLTLANHLTHPDAFRLPSDSNWNFLLVWRVDAQAGTAARVLIGDLEGNPTTTHGFCLYTSGTNTSLLLQSINAAGSAAVAPIYTMPAADVGKLVITGGTYDHAANRLRLFHKRVEIATGSACVGYRAPTSNGASWIGRAAPGQPATNTSVFGWTFGAGVMTLAEYQAAHDAIVAGEDVVSIAGKSQGLWSLKRDPIDVSATVQDRIGSKHFARVGAPSLAPSYARAWGV